MLVGIAALGCHAAGPPQCAGQVYGSRQGSASTSTAGSITSGFKSGVNKFTQMLTPESPVKPADDPVSLANKAEPSASLYLSVARLFEQSGNVIEAQRQYRKALEVSPNDLSTLLSYARLKDQIGEPGEAIKLYRHAAAAHPKVAAVHNNMALFHARRGMLNESIPALQEAVRLEPGSVKYRNNLATVLVEMGRPEEALVHLKAVHSEAVANYNLGYLLEKKGQPQPAMRHFAVAMSMDPSMVPARQAVERLANAPIPAQTPVMPPGAEMRLTSRPPVAAYRAEPMAVSPPPANASAPSPNMPDDAYPRARGTEVRQLPPPPRPVDYDVQPSGPRLERGDFGPDQAYPATPPPRRLPPTSQSSAARSPAMPPPMIARQPAASTAPLPPEVRYLPADRTPAVSR